MNSKIVIKPIDCTISPEIQEVISMIEYINDIAIPTFMNQSFIALEHHGFFIGEKASLIAGTP